MARRFFWSSLLDSWPGWSRGGSRTGVSTLRFWGSRYSVSSVAFCSASAPSGSWIHLADLRYRESARLLCVSDEAFGCHWTLSLCPKSDVSGGCERHPWSGLDPRKRRAAPIRRACLASVSLLCTYLRGTNPKSEFWFRLRDLLCRGPAVDSPSHAVDLSSGRITPSRTCALSGLLLDHAHSEAIEFKSRR